MGNEFHSYDMCLRNVDTILAQMQLTYLDACLIHWPFGYLEGGTILSEVDYLETWAFVLFSFTVFIRRWAEVRVHNA